MNASLICPEKVTALRKTPLKRVKQGDERSSPAFFLF